MTRIGYSGPLEGCRPVRAVLKTGQPVRETAAAEAGSRDQRRFPLEREIAGEIAFSPD
jgi:hypothetical protein